MVKEFLGNKKEKKTQKQLLCCNKSQDISFTKKCIFYICIQISFEEILVQLAVNMERHFIRTLWTKYWAEGIQYYS